MCSPVALQPHNCWGEGSDVEVMVVEGYHSKEYFVFVNGIGFPVEVRVL
jgi:hypothetical protein